MSSVATRWVICTGPVEAQQLVDRRADQLGRLPQQRELVGRAQQRQQPLPKRFTVVSWPATSSSTASARHFARR